jgi:hypothetical protein
MQQKEKDNKYDNELKLPKTLKDMLLRFFKKVGYNKEIIKKLRVNRGF